MTVPADHPSKTSRAAWAALREEVLERAEDRCERCKAPNGKWISRHAKDPARYMTWEGEVFDGQGNRLGMCRGSEWGSDHVATVVLTLAHLDADGDVCTCEPACTRADHVQALCQRCHNVYDGPKRRRNAARTRRAMGGQGTLPGMDP